ncbi:MAG: hypothetical protein P4L46_04655 [Fimbriimonas sp.]|nr:hypothetical protein [Fimbriimonas sp.]
MFFSRFVLSRQRLEASPKSILRTICGLTAAVVLSGCGGGGPNFGGTKGGGGGVTTPVQPSNSATFQVDLTTGKVQVISSAGSGKAIVQSRAIFVGNTIGYTTSDLVNDSGLSTGIRSTNVSLTNNFGLAIGADSTGAQRGVKVVLGPITNLAAPIDLRPFVNVSTFAGTGVLGSNNGPSSSATFGSPRGVALDASGAIYVTDDNYSKIRKISNGYVTTLAGGGTIGADGVGASAGFKYPRGIALNPVDGSLIVADFGAHQVRRVTTSGIVSTIAGVVNTPGYIDGAGNTAEFNSPWGVAVDQSGAIYVADSNNNMVRKISFLGGDPTKNTSYSVSTLTGMLAGGSTDGPPGTAKLLVPAGLAYDGQGNIYEADSGSEKIRRIDTLTGNTVTIAGTGTKSSTDGLGSTATFNVPRGIAYVNGAIVVADSGSNFLRQLILLPGAASSSSQGWQVSTMTNGGTGATDGDGTVASFSTVDFLAASPSGALYISDIQNHKVRRLVPTNGQFPIGVATGSPSTAPVSVSNADGYEAGNGTGTQLPFFLYNTVLGRGQTTDPKIWSFNVPTGVTAFTFSVNVVADTPVPSTVDSGTGVGSNQSYVRTIAGSPTVSGMVNGPATAALFHGWAFSAVDSSGVLYIADTYNNAIRRMDTNGIVSTVAGDTGVPSAVNGTGDVATFQEPAGIGVTPDGLTIYVADSGNNLIRRVSRTGGDPTRPTSWTVSTVAGTGGSGGNYSADTPGDTATISSPMGLAVDSTSNTIYFTESSGNRIRSIHLRGADPALAHSWIVHLIAGDSAAGAYGLVNGYFTTARFHSPFSLALDKVGNLYVADELNNAIRKITPAGLVSTLAGSATAGYADGSGASAQFTNPVGVAADSAGICYVADYSNHRIRAISPSGVVSTVAGNGSSGHVDGPGASAQISFPVGIAVLPGGTLITGSQNDASIRAIDRSYATAN